MADFCPVAQNICVSRGDSPVIPVQVRDDSETVVDILGYTFTLTVDTSPAPSSAANNQFTLSGVITDAPNGRVQFQPTESNTNLAPGVYFYDIQMVTTAPSKRTILAGEFEVRQDITKT